MALGEETAAKTHTAQLVILSQLGLPQLGSPVLAASFKDADSVLSVAALPCPVPCSCFIRWRQANEERDTIVSVAAGPL